MRKLFTMACMIVATTICGKVSAQLDLSKIDQIIPIYMNQLIMEDYDLDLKIKQDLRTNDNTLHLYLWTGSSYVGIAAEGKGFYGQVGSYLNLEATSTSGTWTGLGFCAVETPSSGGAPVEVDFTMLVSEGWRFHGAFKSTSNTRAHHLYICGTNEAHGHFLVGVGQHADNPAWPNLTPTWSTTGWNEVDFAMADLPGFSARAKYTGNYFCALSGAPVIDFAIDAVFLYKPKGSNISGVKADDLNISINGDELMVAGSEFPVELYNLIGMKVKSSSDNKMDIGGLSDGTYIVKSGGLAQKVLLKK